MAIARRFKARAILITQAPALVFGATCDGEPKPREGATRLMNLMDAYDQANPTHRSAMMQIPPWKKHATRPVGAPPTEPPSISQIT